MVCLFCDAHWHESDECSKYKTDVARRKRPNSNRFCFSCRVESAVAHLPEDKKCKLNDKCIGWFSIEHHKVFCAERIKAMNLFLPKIDHNLLKRFSEMFDLDEKYLMATSSPTASDLIPLKSIKIWQEFDDETGITGLNIVAGLMRLYEMDTDKNKKLFDSIYSKNLICLSRELYIYDADITSEIILQMLSPYTKFFELHVSLITPNITFSEVIKNAPNLEVIIFNIYSTEGNIICGKTWLIDLLKYKNGKNFVKLDIYLDILELDIETLVQFVKTKCMKTVNLEIRFDRDLVGEEVEADEAFKKIKQKLAEYFEYYTAEDSKLTVGFVDEDNDIEFSLKKIRTPKKRIMPSRAATKKKYRNFY
uniref:Uncharacterized protein n=1 Tax=Panagrolaimus sp. ES5 TaxID=591445 RepID=A0AC34G4G6_9BILA